jgi:PPOX class probable F420-dependent enzyme
MATTGDLSADTPAARWAREHLEHDVVGWLTTVTPDGRPQSSVIAFILDGEDIIVYTQPGGVRARNLAANPHVAFNLRGDELGDHVLSIEGVATPDPSIPPLDRNEPYLAKYHEVAVHWGMPMEPTALEYSLPVRIHPTRVRFG